MIIAFTQTTAHLFGDVMSSMYRLRKRQFIERQNYKTFFYKSYEYDQYDMPATTYLAYRDNKGEVRGLCRLAPTDQPYMIKDLWPHMVMKKNLPNSPDIWEATRFCIDDDINQKHRMRIKAELVCACLEYGLGASIKSYLAVTTPALWTSICEQLNCKIEMMGDLTKLACGSKVIAASVPISRENLNNVREQTSISSPVLMDQADFETKIDWQMLNFTEPADLITNRDNYYRKNEAKIYS